MGQHPVGPSSGVQTMSHVHCAPYSSTAAHVAGCMMPYVPCNSSRGRDTMHELGAEPSHRGGAPCRAFMASYMASYTYTCIHPVAPYIRTFSMTHMHSSCTAQAMAYFHQASEAPGASPGRVPGVPLGRPWRFSPPESRCTQIGRMQSDRHRAHNGKT